MYNGDAVDAAVEDLPYAGSGVYPARFEVRWRGPRRPLRVCPMASAAPAGDRGRGRGGFDALQLAGAGLVGCGAREFPLSDAGLVEQDLLGGVLGVGGDWGMERIG